MSRLRAVALTAAVVVCLEAGLPAAELTAPTLAAFDRYVQLTEARMAAELAGAAPLLWVDRQPAGARARAMADLAAGRVVVERMETRDRGEPVQVPDGLIHHWIGTVFIPGVSLERVLALVQDYPRYPVVFGPLVRAAAVVDRDGTRDNVRFDVTMRTETHKVIAVVIDGTYAIAYRRLDDTRVAVRTVARDLREVESAGTAAERRVPAERGRGYLWRMNSYCAFEARPEGTYEQCESVSLSRDLPFGIGWLVAPFVTSVPKETLAFTLGRVRAALTLPKQGISDTVLPDGHGRRRDADYQRLRGLSFRRGPLAARLGEDGGAAGGH